MRNSNKISHIKHFKRYRKIARVFLKHGLGYLIKRMGLDSLLPWQKRQEVRDSEREADSILADRLCRALSELGPTFIKLGQLFSTRPDMFAPAYIEELEKLQDKVQPFSYAEVVEQLQKELGHPEEIFAEFNPEPLAAASIGQVHMGLLKSGEKVIVKIQRPNIEEMVESDLEILLELAELSEKRSVEAQRLGIVDMLNDYARLLLRELDYDREARNTERVYQNFANDERVIIPRVYWQYTTRKVLTQDYIEGVKLSSIDEIKARGWDRGKTSRLGTEAFLSQIVLHGFFQADPHPGNILVIDEEHIAFIDFGEVSALSERRLTSLGELLLGIESRDMDKAVATLEDMGILTDSVDMDAFQEDFADIIEQLSASRIGNLNMNRIRKNLMDIAYRYQLNIPSYLTSLIKALITVEGVGKKLDPTFNFLEVAEPLAQKVLQERMKPGNIYGYIRRKYYSDLRPLISIPANFDRLLKATEKGKLNMNIQIGFSGGAKRSITKLVNRLSASLIIAGGLVSSALIIQSSHSEVIVNHATLGIIGFAVSLCALIIFIVSFFRS
ncbi:MAG: AarF/ABC1/UbiB kinase family protein [Syntrophomonas sp.]|nr:AarF/ABC1/UbiB kinase family protein [Syntrophomonas sp.]